MNIISFDASNSNTMNNQLKELWLLDQAKQYSSMFYVSSSILDVFVTKNIGKQLLYVEESNQFNSVYYTPAC